MLRIDSMEMLKKILADGNTHYFVVEDPIANIDLSIEIHKNGDFYVISHMTDITEQVPCDQLDDPEHGTNTYIKEGLLFLEGERMKE